MEILVALLIEWLSLNTNVQIETPPAVVVDTPANLAAKYGAPVYALYSHEKKVIYLSDQVDVSTLRGASVLLHELVHHYQNESGAMDGYSCVRQSEQLAYDTQRLYLEANKAPLIPELSPYNVALRSICAGPRY